MKDETALTRMRATEQKNKAQSDMSDKSDWSDDKSAN